MESAIELPILAVIRALHGGGPRERPPKFALGALDLEAVMQPACNGTMLSENKRLLWRGIEQEHSYLSKWLLSHGNAMVLAWPSLRCTTTKSSYGNQASWWGKFGLVPACSLEIEFGGISKVSVW